MSSMDLNMDLQIVIIDDDSWIRRGRAVAIDETPGFSVIGTMSPTDALAQHDAEWWSNIDVVLADAHDDDAGFDKFIGVRVVAHIRSLTGRTKPQILVITGHLYNDLLRLRMAEAGADFFYSHAEVRSPEALVGAITASREAVGQPQILPVSPSPGLNAAVSWAEANLGEGAFQNESQKALPVSRRAIITARQRLRHQLPTSDGRTIPSWREISQFIDRARGKERRGP
jgi:DNA-binding NarL/FixJ family response regulator